MDRYEQVRAVKVFHRGASRLVDYDHDDDDDDEYDTPRREREIAVATEYKLIC